MRQHLRLINWNTQFIQTKIKIALSRGITHRRDYVLSCD